MSHNIYTDRFMGKIPRTPLARHIEALHTMAYLSGVHGSALEVFEHHLTAIAVFSAEPPEYRIPASAGTHDTDHAMDLRYDASLLTPHYEAVSSFDAASVQRVLRKATTALTDGIRAMRAKADEMQTPEGKSKRRYERMVADERRKAKDHLRSEVARVRRELGLPDTNKTGA